MILDSVKFLSLYAGCIPELAKVVAYLKEVEQVGMPDTKMDIDGENLFVIPSRGAGKGTSDALLEAHDAYIDVQVCFGTAETFGWKNRNNCLAPLGTFDTEKDIIFFEDKPSTFLTIRKGEFVIFMPNDAHAPLMYDGEVVKLIFKIRVS